MYGKLEEKVKLNGYSPSTLHNYSRCIARIALHFKCLPLDLPPNQINQYLLLLRDNLSPSESFFKHTVYGLRFLFRLYGQEDRAIELPSLKRLEQLPVVLSRAECRRLFITPKLLKHRIFLCLAYSAGLRLQEICKLEWRDIDYDRMQIHIRKTKYNKDRYVPLSQYIAEGLKKYRSTHPRRPFVFSGKQSDTRLSGRAGQWIVRRAVKESGMEKKASMHTLRHSYATHLLEDGVDLYTIKDLLGHSRIETTLVYLHIADTTRKAAHSPLDTLYKK